ncbi:hypothetical protein GMJAKD_08370 [Candidatus Electrothrix aarhusensis]
MKSLSYSITSRTPIVTGDHDHRNTELQATGILGSLRYQYWLLKAVQAWQTDPENPVYPLYSAELPSKKGPKDPAFFTALGAAGSVVQLFGGTNWKKMFRFALTEAVQGAGQPCSARADDRQAQKTPYQWKQVALTFQQDRKISFFNGTEGERIHNEVEELMSFVHQYGWLGAAPQNGLGWVRVQGQAQNQPSLPNNNPVFAAKDIVLTAQEADRLKDELLDFFSKKMATRSINTGEKAGTRAVSSISDRNIPLVGLKTKSGAGCVRPPPLIGKEKTFFVSGDKKPCRLCPCQSSRCRTEPRMADQNAFCCSARQHRRISLRHG